MQSSIFKLLCLIVFSFVVMSEPPEKIDVVSMTPIDAEISLAGQYTTASGVVYKRTASGQWKKQPQIVVPTIDSSAMSGYYQTPAGQWKKRQRSTAPVVASDPIVAPPIFATPTDAPPIFPPVILAGCLFRVVCT